MVSSVVQSTIHEMTRVNTKQFNHEARIAFQVGANENYDKQKVYRTLRAMFSTRNARSAVLNVGIPAD